jgi:hypothetical protein
MISRCLLGWPLILQATRIVEWDKLRKGRTPSRNKCRRYTIDANILFQFGAWGGRPRPKYLSMNLIT